MISEKLRESLNSVIPPQKLARLVELYHLSEDKGQVSIMFAGSRFSIINFIFPPNALPIAMMYRQLREQFGEVYQKFSDHFMRNHILDRNEFGDVMNQMLSLIFSIVHICLDKTQSDFNLFIEKMTTEITSMQITDKDPPEVAAKQIGNYCEMMNDLITIMDYSIMIGQIKFVEMVELLKSNDSELIKNEAYKYPIEINEFTNMVELDKFLKAMTDTLKKESDDPKKESDDPKKESDDPYDLAGMTPIGRA